MLNNRGVQLPVPDFSLVQDALQTCQTP
ncbi:hypothetical protein BsWGS_17044 [Bradybaena similaris]